MQKESIASPNLLVFAFCENIIQDTSKKYSLINMFDTIHVADLPGVFSCGLFIAIYFLAGEYSIGVKSYSPKGEIFEMPIYPDLKRETNGYFNFVVNLGININEVGEYSFQLFVNNKLIGERVFNVVIQEKPVILDK